MRAIALGDYTSRMWDAALTPPEPTLCTHCSRDVDGGEAHAEWCPGHPDFLERAEGIAQAALAGLFCDFGLSSAAVTIRVHAGAQGVVADVRVMMTYPQLEEAA